MVKFASELCAERKLETTRVGTPKHLITKERKSMGNYQIHFKQNHWSHVHTFSILSWRREKGQGAGRSVPIPPLSSEHCTQAQKPCGLPVLSMVSIPPGERNHLRVT